MEGPPSEFITHHRPLLFLAGVVTFVSESKQPSTNETSGGNIQSDPNDPFASLLDSLRKVMAPKRGYNIWDNSRGVNADFHVIVVDKVRTIRHLQ